MGGLTSPVDITSLATAANLAVVDANVDILEALSYDLIRVDTVRSLTSTGVSNAVSVSEAGVLVAVSVVVTIALDVSGGSPVCLIEVVVDGGTTRTTGLYNNSSTFDYSQGGVFAANVGWGATVDHFLVIPFGAVRYETSLRVGLNVSQVAGTAGAVRIGVIRGARL